MTLDKPFRIWVLHCPFKKSGFPSVGSFGATTQPTVVMTMETWNRLCETVPALKTTQFEVGTQE